MTNRLKAILAGVFVQGAISYKYSPKRAARAKKDAIEYALLKIKELKCTTEPEERPMGNVRGKPLGDRIPDDEPFVFDDPENVLGVEIPLKKRVVPVDI